MKLAEDIWLKSVTAQSNIVAAANYSTAFVQNAAVQSVHVTLTTPMVFWSAFSRALDAELPRTGEVVNLFDAPKETDVAAEPESEAETEVALPDIDTAAAPIVDIPVEPVAETPAPVVEAEAAPEVDDIPAAKPGLVLLDEPRGGKADDLTEIKGIGAKMSASLTDFGIYHFDQIAGLDQDGIDWLDQHLPGFKRNCARFDLIASAKSLV